MPERDNKLTRRTMLAGAGAGGALAAAAVLLPRDEPRPAAKTMGERVAADDSADGYRLTEHIRKYYRAARV